MKPIRPDLASRPFACSVERMMNASPAVIYKAFTVHFDQWFAAPGTLLLKPALDVPFFFETRFKEQRHPHYGRYLELTPNERLEMTWVTGNPGTLGAETIVSVDIASHGDGAHVTLTHAGFVDEASRDGHAKAWPDVLAHLDQSMSEKQA